jgi:imidazolonepropionase
MRDLGFLPEGAVAVDAGKIVRVGPTVDLEADFAPEVRLDARGGVVAPGFVDPHTHPVFTATREAEWELRIEGIPYEEIARRGGGILSTVRAVRAASAEELEAATRAHLDSFLAQGTTTVEAKSGYGLSWRDELKSLQVLQRLQAFHPIGVVATFLGAHEIPAEHRNDREAWIRILTDQLIPEAATRGLAKYCDVFCERGVYTVEESRRILRAAQRVGLRARVHADEFSALGASELAGEMKAVSADHLVSITDAGIRALKDNDVIPVLLPATSFFLNLPHDAPARKMIEEGLPVALATDFNPGSCPCDSMPLVMTVACVRLRMTPAEAFTAATVNAAAALELQDEIGLLREGMQADLVVFAVPDYRRIAYRFGANHVAAVVKRGKIVVGAEAD